MIDFVDVVVMVVAGVGVAGLATFLLMRRLGLIDAAAPAREIVWPVADDLGAELPVPAGRRGFGVGNCVALMLVGLISVVWFRYGSIDRALREVLHVGGEAEVVASAAVWLDPRADVAHIDGVHWIRLIGTTSTGLGYHGWVSELAFRSTPPAPTGKQGFAEKLGLPSAEDRLKAMKQMHDLGNELQRQLKRQ